MSMNFTDETEYNPHKVRFIQPFLKELLLASISRAFIPGRLSEVALTGSMHEIKDIQKQGKAYLHYTSCFVPEKGHQNLQVK